MFIASNKKKENIAEYVLYMWQIEDIIRSMDFDMEKIEKNVISQFQLDDEKRKSLREWYESLIDMMLKTGKREKGHLQMIDNTVEEVNSLHKALLMAQKYPDYTSTFYKVLPLIAELRTKEGYEASDVNTLESCDVNVALSFMYGVLMLRLKGQNITEETEKAEKDISRMLALLSKYYNEYKKEELDL